MKQLAARVRPAVVQIFSTGYARPEQGDDDSVNTALLSKQTSTGSGVILTSDGYIVTNNHVVDNARKIEVKLPTRGGTRTQGMTLAAKVVGVDRDTDLAVLKIDAQNLATLALADSSQLNQGELVMAFGNPFGLEGSASTGVVSSTSRQLKEDDPLAYIQTDAPINPGNSGGPLVDMEAHVVGINTMIYTRSGGSEGVGFALPSNVVKNGVRPDSQGRARASRAHRRGIADASLRRWPKGSAWRRTGAWWSATWKRTAPAAKAGVMIGDIVKAFDGKTVEDASQLENAIYGLALAESVKLDLLRDGKTIDVTVPVHEREDDPQRFADMVNPEDNLIPKLGILAMALDEKIAAMLPELRHEYGLVVAARTPMAPYSGSEIETGDVIYEMNRMPTLTVKGVRDILEAMKSGDAVVLQVERGGRLMYLALELE